MGWLAARAAAVAVAAAAASATATTTASPLHLDAPTPPTGPAPLTPRLVAEPATKLELPASLTHRGAELALVGLGVRRVTFLGINVYVAGLYVERAAAEAAARAHAACAPDARAIDLERQVAEWLAGGAHVGIRIVPVRATDFAHLRDGLVRAVNVRARAAIAGDEAAEAAGARALSAGVHALKGLFPRTRVARGSALDLIAQRAGGASGGGAYRLDVVYGGELLGSVSGSGRAPLPAQLVLAYVSERPDISRALRTSVQEHLYAGVV